MSTTHPAKGPRSYRFLVTVLNVLLAILVYWVLGFLLDDLSNQPGPSWQTIQNQFKDPALVQQKEMLITQAETLSQQMNVMQKQQELLQTSINSYRDTMNQLVDLQKISAQKNQTLGEQTQQNLASATALYLGNQQKFQALNNALTQTNNTLQQTQNKISMIDVTLNSQTKSANDVYNAQQQKHNYKIALYKLALLIPLLIITAFFFRQYRQSIYRPMLIAVGIAIIIRIVFVMHEHFPYRAFKYLLILILLALVARSLMNLLKMKAKPKSSWLQKQYVDAYKKLICPECDYPVWPGILNYAMLTQDRLKNITVTDKLHNVEKYVCPNCGTRLFEECHACKHTRHSLLRYCEFCGIEAKP